MIGLSRRAFIVGLGAVHTNNDNGRIRRVVFASVYFEGPIFHFPLQSFSIWENLSQIRHKSHATI